MPFSTYNGPFPLPETTMAPSPDSSNFIAPRMDPISLNSPQSGSLVVRTLGMPNMDDQLAHFQQLTNRLISPYNIVGQNSWLAQNHPQAASILDRVGTTLALTPGPRGPEGVGGGISRTFEGLMGANQLERQKAFQAATLPYQLMMPQLQMQNLQSEIDYRNSEVPWRHSETALNNARADHYADMMDQGKVGTPQVDKAGQLWIPRTTSRGVELYNAVTQQKADPNNPPEFVGKLDRAQQEYGGGTVGRIIAMQQSDDPDTKQKGIDAARIFTGIQAASAGLKTGADQNAPHPQVTADKLVDSARQTLSKDEFLDVSDEESKSLKRSSAVKDPLDYLTKGFASDMNEANKLYQSDISLRNTVYSRQRQQVESYISSDQAKKGVSFDEYKKQQKNTPSPKSSTNNSGSNWTPKS